MVWLCKVIQKISDWLQSYKHGRETSNNGLVLCFKWLASSTAFVFESVLDGLTSFFYYIKMFPLFFLYSIKLYLRYSYFNYMKFIFPSVSTF